MTVRALPRSAVRSARDWPSLTALRRVAVLSAPVALGTVVVLVFFLPARAVVPSLGAAGRPHFLVATALLVWWLLAQVHPRLRSRNSSFLTAVVVTYVGWVIVAWAAGYDRGLTVEEGNGSDRAVLAALAYLGVVLVASTGLRSVRQIDTVLKVTVAGATFSAVVGWVQFWLNFDLSPRLILPGLQAVHPLVSISTRGSGFARVAGTAGHYIEFGVVTAMLVPLAIHYARSRPKGQQKLAWTAVFIMAAAVPFSVSRSGLVALAVTALVMLLGWPRRLRWNAIGAMALAVPAYMVVTPGLLGTIKSLFLNASNDPSITGRTSDYATVWAYVAERPIIGRGPGTFLPAQYILLDNQWLLNLVEIGWVGMALFAVVLLATMRALMTIRRRALFLGDSTQADLALSLLVVPVTVAVSAALFDEFYFTTATTIFWLVVGITAALWHLQGRRLAEVGIVPMSAGQRVQALLAIARRRDVDRDEALWI